MGSSGRCSMSWSRHEVSSERSEEGRNEVKSHERLKAEGAIERLMEDTLWENSMIDGDNILRAKTGDYLIEVKAHYLGSKKRLKEPHVD